MLLFLLMSTSTLPALLQEHDTLFSELRGNLETFQGTGEEVKITLLGESREGASSPREIWVPITFFSKTVTTDRWCGLPDGFSEPKTIQELKKHLG